MIIEECQENLRRKQLSCLAANGIKVYIFPSLRPTPELSFAVRELHCTAGIMVTAKPQSSRIQWI